MNDHDWEEFAKRAYWYYLMTTQGGPDGSELDEAVREDMEHALRAWAATLDDPDYLDYFTRLDAGTATDPGSF